MIVAGRPVAVGVMAHCLRRIELCHPLQAIARPPLRASFGATSLASAFTTHSARESQKTLSNLEEIAMAFLFELLRLTSWDDDRGQDLVEYAMIIVLVILGIVALLSALGDVLIEAYYNLVIEAFGG
jgi:Flp pilus assembly pilin Flp